MTRPAQAYRFTAQSWTLLDHYDADLYINPTPHRDRLSRRHRSSMPRLGSAELTTTIDPPGRPAAADQTRPPRT